MKTSEALLILRALADGVDPNTGETFSENSPYQHPRIVRALYRAVVALEQLELNEKKEEMQQRASRLPRNAGKPWSSVEDNNLAADFDSGIRVKELAQKYQRTRGAIQSRLARLGKI